MCFKLDIFILKWSTLPGPSSCLSSWHISQSLHESFTKLMLIWHIHKRRLSSSWKSMVWSVQRSFSESELWLAFPFCQGTKPVTPPECPDVVWAMHNAQTICCRRAFCLWSLDHGKPLQMMMDRAEEEFPRKQPQWHIHFLLFGPLSITTLTTLLNSAPSVPN